MLNTIAPDMKRGAAYIRVSTDEQTELSPDAQLREIRQAAAAEGVIIPQEYIFMEERGRSGRRADNRPEFQRMIAVARQKPAPFEYLYLWKFSRFARNQEESTFYKGILRKKCGITIKSVSEPIMDGMFGRLVEMIIEWSDEFYSVNLSGEVIRGMTEKAMRRGYQSTPCLGYDAVGEGNPFVINEEQYRIAAFIHQSFFRGKDLTAIAREANESGCRTRRGNSFTSRAVRNVLTNPFYIGTVTWNDIQFQGTHETRAEITSVFAANQERLAKDFRPTGRREVSSCKHWLSGLLICGECGASLSCCRSGTDRNRSACFQCWKYTKGLHASSCSVSVKKAEAAVLASLQQLQDISRLTCTWDRQWGENSQKTASARHTAFQKLAQKEERLRAAYLNGIDTLEEYRKSREKIDKERQALSQRNSTGASSVSPDCRETIQTINELIANPDVDYKTKGNALRRIIKKITYDRKEQIMKFYYYL